MPQSEKRNLSQSPDISHFFLTRFNIITPGKEKRLRDQENWLENRFSLFFRYCLPSVLAQSAPDFRWLIYFDEGTPARFRERMEVLDDRILCHFIPSVEFNLELIKENILTLAGGGQWLLTSRIDNDDAISADYVERLRAELRPEKKMVYNFTNGLCLSNQKLYLFSDASNAFTSILEPVTDFETVWCTWHTRLNEIAPIVQIGGGPAWLQVIHGQNVSNRTRGRRVTGERYLRKFNLASPETTDDTRRSIFFDNAILYPIRAGRDLTKNIIKLAGYRSNA